MTALALTARRSWFWSTGLVRQRITWVAGLGLLLIAIAWEAPEARDLLLAALADAYVQVSVFVAATLALFYGLERLFKIDAGSLLARHPRWQVPAAAFLGALPGCGGAILVVTQYVRGRISFGAVLAVLTATMGDAAFLLLSQEPATGLAVLAIGFTIGMITGWAVDAIHGPDFLRQHARQRPIASADVDPARPAHALNGLWLALAAPGLVIGVLTALQIDADALFGTAILPHPTLWLGVAGSLLAVTMWALTPDRSLAANMAAERDDRQNGIDRTLDRIIGDTNFVTAWVVLAFVGYELGMYVTGFDLQHLFAVWAPVVPLIGVLVGLLPGCGPQVVVTTLYLNGIVPFSAQIGNAISNDGDALFPAIALAPRVALVATLYSAVPALIVSYAVWWLWA